MLVTTFIPLAHKRRKATDPEMAHYRKAMPTPESRRASAAMPGQIIGARVFFTDLEGELASLSDLPTLILWADRDPIFTAKYRKRWESIYPGATTTVVEGAGHFSCSPMHRRSSVRPSRRGGPRSFRKRLNRGMSGRPQRGMSGWSRSGMVGWSPRCRMVGRVLLGTTD